MPVLRARVLTPLGPDEVRFLPDARVEWQDGVIASVAPWSGGACDEDLRDGVLVPGFVDAHVHYPQTRIVGAATGALLDWLARSTFPEEARFADPSHARRVARTFATSLAASGTTLSMVYGPVFPDATDAACEAMADAGLKVIAGPVWMDEDCPPALRLSAAASAEGVEALVERWHSRDGVQIAVIPRFALCCSAEAMRTAADLAARLGLVTSTHLAETPDECRIARERFGTADYLRVYEDAGLVRRGTVLAHCVYLSEGEWDRVAAAGAVVAHCPDSNFFLGSGRMPPGPPERRGVPIAIGTDVAAGRSFRVPRILSSAYDSALSLGVSLDPRRLLWWGTRGGALALGHPETGEIAAGRDADLVLLDVPDWADDVDAVLAAILFDHDAPRPRRTWCRGREVWRRDGPAFPWSAEPAR